MSNERLAMLARRWGLVGLGALAYCAVRLLVVLLDQLSTFQRNTDWRVLSASLSQLKPPAFKSGPLSLYAIALAVLLGATLLVMLVVGVRAALRPDAPPPEEGPR